MNLQDPWVSWNEKQVELVFYLYIGRTGKKDPHFQCRTNDGMDVIFHTDSGL